MLGDAAALLGVVIADIIIAFTSLFIAAPIVLSSLPYWCYGAHGVSSLSRFKCSWKAFQLAWN